MKNKLSVTIVVTVLNEDHTIIALLSALKDQTHKAQQVIVVDGGSHDTTLEILTQYTQQFSHFPLLAFTKKGNRSIGRNAGIAKASTNLIAITDAGCVPHSNWLAELIKTYQSSKAPVVAGYYDAQPKTNFEQAVVPYVLVMPDKVDPKNFLPATRSMLIEKSIWQKMGGFDESLSDNEDYAFAQQLKKRQIPMAFSEQAKVTWQPRSNLSDFGQMIRRFAKGDTFAGIWRPKVIFVFVRYIVAITFEIFLLLMGRVILAEALFISGGLGYLLWAISKNYRYAKQGWYWLPILQCTADWMVMLGSLQGWLTQK